MRPAPSPLRLLSLCALLAPIGCGARVVLIVYDSGPHDSSAVADVGADAGFDVDAGTTPVVDAGFADVGFPDVGFDAGVDVGSDVGFDVGPLCTEGDPCPSMNECLASVTRCMGSHQVCVMNGPTPYGTRCATGVCDGRGACMAPSQQSCPAGSETGCGIVNLLGGTFALGETGAFRAAPVQRAITVSAFAMDASEVTVARFRRFWDAGHPAPPAALAYPGGTFVWSGAVVEPGTGADCNWNAAGRDYHPVNCVDYPTAQAFCVWDGGRLPTEAEWEFAARVTLAAGLNAGRVYPWGDTAPSATCDRAQWNHCAGDDGGATRRVGQFANTAGFFDLAGNVWEWTADSFAAYSDPGCWGGTARVDPYCARGTSTYPAIRGGSWFSESITLLRAASRDDAYMPATRSAILGLRCARARAVVGG